ncbi:MAG: hypothetical protein JNK02_05685 [Planctomycetes bacterium]|nr:hypothetical protein [Planctomycetota bacterium]
MKPVPRLLLLLGCVLVAALVCPGAARVAAEDLFGPYAEDHDAAGELLADAGLLDVQHPTHHADDGAGPVDGHDEP